MPPQQPQFFQPSRVRKKLRKLKKQPYRFFKDSKYLWFIAVIFRPVFVILWNNIPHKGNKLKEIKDLSKQGDYENAAKVAISFTEKFPNNIEVYTLLIKIGKKSLADELMMKLLEKHPIAQKSLLTAIKYYLITDDTERAHEFISCLEMEWNTSPAIQLLACDLYSLSGHLKVAESKLKKWMILNPEYKNSEHIRTILRILCQMGDFDQAYRLFCEVADSKLDTMKRRILFGQNKILEGYELFNTEQAVHNILDNIANGSILPTYSNKDLAPDEKILFFMYYGIGDEIRFSTIYPLIAQKYKNSSITCDPRLFSILSRSYSNVTFVPCQRDYDYTTEQFISPKLNKIFDLSTANLLKDKKYDKLAYVASQLSVFKPALESYDNKKTYLIADSELRKKWGGRLKSIGSNKKIGICWRSDKLSPDRCVHYTNIKAWKNIFQIEGVDFINLQYAPFVDELKNTPIISFDDLNLKDDFESTAALICELDLVISPCTALIELCGALGKLGLYTSNSYDVDWRVDRNNHCIWFNSIRFVKAEPYGNKSSLLENLEAEIRKFVAESSAKAST